MNKNTGFFGLSNILTLTSRCLSAEADQMRRPVIVAMGESLQQQIRVRPPNIAGNVTTLTGWFFFIHEIGLETK